MKKIIIGIVILIVIVTLVIVFGSNKKAIAPTPEQAITTDQQTTNPPPRNDAVESQEKTVITYTDAGFSPSSVTIKQGDVVVFENKSSSNFWPASNDHPTHTIYPEFDAKKSISVGKSYTFTFEKAGTWGYHNHLKPSQKGTIIVLQIYL